MEVKPLRSLAYGEVRLRLGRAALLEKRAEDAARWVVLAATNDHTEGLKELAAGYRCGVGGLTQSEFMETSMLRRAAELGDMEAQYRSVAVAKLRILDLSPCDSMDPVPRCGVLADEGRGGLNQSDIEAKRLYRAASVQDHPLVSADRGASRLAHLLSCAHRSYCLYSVRPPSG